MSISTLAFNGIQLNPINHNNQIWLTSSELASSLGYADEGGVRKIYNRYKDEFSASMSVILPATQIDPLGEYSGLQREIRVFSLRGCHLLAMFSRTAIAKQFRVWVLDVLDKEVGQPKPYGLKDQPKITKKPKPELTQKGYDCWMSMVEIFGNQLINEYGTLPPTIWMEAIEELTEAQIKCGFEGIKKSRSPFMPRLPVFLAYCHEKDVVSAKDKDMELVDKKKQIAMSCESRAEILKHVEFNQVRINMFEDFLNGMKRSNEAFKGTLAA